MRDRRAHRVIPWLLAIALLLVPLAGSGIDAQTTTGAATGPVGQTGERRGSDPGSGRIGRATHGGLHIADMSSGITTQQLANSLVGGQGVTISNVTYTGAQVSAGTFNGGSSIIGIDSGIMLGSGHVVDAVGPNNSDSSGVTLGGGGDASLNSLISPGTTQDATVLEFDFVPQGNTLSFQYVFASDEYNEFVGSQFNDVFAFFVNGQNVATIPGTNTPVSINNVNQGNPSRNHPPTNTQFYRNNDLQDGGGPINTQMDGLTVVLSVQAAVNPGVTNHMKLAIADVGDGAYDSNVFIKAGSFSSGCATMKLQPQFPNEPLGATFTVAIVVDAACDVDAAEAHLNFDASRLQVVDVLPAAGVQITPGTELPNVTLNTADNVQGRIGYAARLAAPVGASLQPAGQPAGVQAAVTGTFTLATITFQTIASTGTGGTPLTFVFGGARNTSISFAGSSVFGGATDGSVTIGTITATPTSGPPGGAPTVTQTATPQLPSTPTATPFVPGGPIGGAGFGLSPSAAGSLLTWLGGNAQTGYQILRLGSVPMVLPTGGTLPAAATDFLDTGTIGFVGQPFCYLLTPTGVAGNLVSDLLCTLANTRSLVGAPQNFTIRLNQSKTASFTWAEPIGGGQTGYILFILGELGGSTSPIVLPADATSTSHVMQSPTCYVLFALAGNVIRGNTDIVCGAPGFGNIGFLGTTTPTATLPATATPAVTLTASATITVTLSATATITPSVAIPTATSTTSPGQPDPTHTPVEQEIPLESQRRRP